MTRSIALVIHPGFQLMDAAGPLAVFEIARALCSSQDVDTLLGQISGAVEKLTASEAASILLLDATKKQLVFRVATGEKGSSVKRFYVPLGKGIAGWVAEHGEAVIINDVTLPYAMVDGFARRFSNQADRFRKELTEWYGEEKAKNIKYAEAFEICEYGRQPNKQELAKLFPFHEK